MQHRGYGKVVFVFYYWMCATWKKCQNRKYPLLHWIPAGRTPLATYLLTQFRSDHQHGLWPGVIGWPWLNPSIPNSAMSKWNVWNSSGPRWRKQTNLSTHNTLYNYFAVGGREIEMIAHPIKEDKWPGIWLKVLYSQSTHVGGLLLTHVTAAVQ